MSGGLAVKADGGVEGDHPPPFFLMGAAPFARVCTERSEGRPGKRPAVACLALTAWGPQAPLFGKNAARLCAPIAVAGEMHPASESDSDRPKAARERNAVPRPVKRASAGGSA